mmetsp:Transcript_2804/g.4306  ORF Transcript_2804/g.4306 Transcript_2804/m.4306 type:complete len:81 (+) Transcript_2804:99-341(+)
MGNHHSNSSQKYEVVSHDDNGHNKHKHVSSFDKFLAKRYHRMSRTLHLDDDADKEQQAEEGRRLFTNAFKDTPVPDQNQN